MKVAVMQPYFFPYLGYYSLIKYTDKFILFDVVQFIRHGWIERNRILKPGDGWNYIAVPLEKHRRTVAINEVEIRNGEDWKGKIFRQLEHYKKKAPFYNDTLAVVESSLAIETGSIVNLNANILMQTCKYLGLPIDLQIYSEMNLKIGEATYPGQWALNISKALHAKEYLNPTGGMEIFAGNHFQKE